MLKEDLVEDLVREEKEYYHQQTFIMCLLSSLENSINLEHSSSLYLDEKLAQIPR